MGAVPFKKHFRIVNVEPASFNGINPRKFSRPRRRHRFRRNHPLYRSLNMCRRRSNPIKCTPTTPGSRKPVVGGSRIRSCPSQHIQRMSKISRRAKCFLYWWGGTRLSSQGLSHGRQRLFQFIQSSDISATQMKRRFRVWKGGGLLIGVFFPFFVGRFMVRTFFI